MAIPASIANDVLRRLLTPYLEVELHATDPGRSKAGAIQLSGGPLYVDQTYAAVRGGAIVMTRDSEEVRGSGAGGHAAWFSLWHAGTTFVLSGRLRRSFRVVEDTPVILKAGSVLVAFDEVR